MICQLKRAGRTNRAAANWQAALRQGENIHSKDGCMSQALPLRALGDANAGHQAPHVLHGCMSYSPSSSSNSPSSSAVASWYCWYSDTRSFMLLSASVNSISSIPSPVYQCRNAFLRNMAVKNSATRLNISWIAVEFPANATAIFRPLGGMSQTLTLMLFGIHSTK